MCQHALFAQNECCFLEVIGRISCPNLTHSERLPLYSKAPWIAFSFLIDTLTWFGICSRRCHGCYKLAFLPARRPAPKCEMPLPSLHDHTHDILTQKGTPDICRDICAQTRACTQSTHPRSPDIATAKDLIGNWSNDGLAMRNLVQEKG